MCVHLLMCVYVCVPQVSITTHSIMNAMRLPVVSFFGEGEREKSRVREKEKAHARLLVWQGCGLGSAWGRSQHHALASLRLGPLPLPSSPAPSSLHNQGGCNSATPSATTTSLVFSSPPLVFSLFSPCMQCCRARKVYMCRDICIGGGEDGRGTEGWSDHGHGGGRLGCHRGEGEREGAEE